MAFVPDKLRIPNSFNTTFLCAPEPANGSKFREDERIHPQRLHIYKKAATGHGTYAYEAMFLDDKPLSPSKQFIHTII